MPRLSKGGQGAKRGVEAEGRSSSGVFDGAAPGETAGPLIRRNTGDVKKFLNVTN